MTRHLAESCDRCTAAALDLSRIQAELMDRLDRCEAFEYEAALRWMVWKNPDIVNEAITETGGPSL